jgi:hypothetical protein
MSKLMMVTLATMVLAIPSISAAARNDRSKAHPPCVTNADGQPGKDNQATTTVAATQATAVTAEPSSSSATRSACNDQAAAPKPQLASRN